MTMRRNRHIPDIPKYQIRWYVGIEHQVKLTLSVSVPGIISIFSTSNDIDSTCNIPEYGPKNFFLLN